MQGFIGKEQDLVIHPVADWQPVQLSRNRPQWGMSPAWDGDDEPSHVILEDLETFKIPFGCSIQERVACVRSPGNSQHVPLLILVRSS